MSDVRHVVTATFRADLAALSPAERAQLHVALREFLVDLRKRTGFRRRLQVEGIEGTRRIQQLAWSRTGRITWQFDGPEHDEHVLWRRIHRGAASG